MHAAPGHRQHTSWTDFCPYLSVSLHRFHIYGFTHLPSFCFSTSVLIDSLYVLTYCFIMHTVATQL